MVDACEVPANIRLVDVHDFSANQMAAKSSQRLVRTTSGTIPVRALHEVLLVDGAENPRHRALQ